jgi:uncharacterized RDD family membrane protein YckC
MVGEMNAIAQVSTAPVTGPKLDNRRVLAAIVDVLIVAVGGALILYAGDSLSGDRQSALSAVILGWALYYYFALESGNGQTVGKRLMKLRVVCADGRPAGMREIAVRTILRVVDGIGVYIVGLIVMLVTGERRQRIGDLAAGTIVVDASAPPAPVAAPEAEVAEEVAEEEPAVEESSPTQTITLPSRPEPPATLSDLTPEPVAEPEVQEDAPAVEDTPAVEDEPVVVPVAEEPLPQVMSPSLEGLAADVAAAQDAGQGAEAEPVEAEPSEDAPDEPSEPEEASDEVAEDDGPVNVKSVETVSAMDLIMGAAEEQASEGGSESGADADGPASA